MCVLQGPKWPKLQDFRRFSTLAETERFAKACSSTLSLCFSREITSQGYPRHLYITTMVVFGCIFPFSPIFALFHWKLLLFLLEEPRERLPIIFPSSVDARGYFCSNSGNATLDLRSTRAPTKENTKKREFAFL